MKRPAPRAIAAFAGIALLVFATACSNRDASDDGTVSGRVTVFAAASLTDAFQELAAAFEVANPGVSVAFNFGSSSALAVQVNEGAPADVFASANEAQMAVVVDADNAAGPALFATNELTVVVPADPTTVTSFSDLAEPGLFLVLAAPEVPAGIFAREALEKAAALPGYGDDFADRVLENLVSNETDVRAVLTKVQLGEADAGIVYATDVAAAVGEVTAIELPAEANVRATYPIVALHGAANPASAQAFVDFTLSQEGRQILERHGFGTP